MVRFEDLDYLRRAERTTQNNTWSTPEFLTQQLIKISLIEEQKNNRLIPNKESKKRKRSLVFEI